MDNNEKAFESYTGTEVFQILLDRSVPDSAGRKFQQGSVG